MHRVRYFSGTGNTAFVAKHIAARLEAMGLDVSIDRIENADPSDCRNIESLFFGFPIFACDMPELVREFVAALPEANRTPVRLFSTMAFFSGKAMTRAARAFAEKGYTIAPTYERKMPEAGMKKKFRADENCTSCGLCVRNCPVRNIRMVDGKVQFGGDCMLCMRCIHQCPAEAIQIGKKTVGKFRCKGPGTI